MGSSRLRHHSRTKEESWSWYSIHPTSSTLLSSALGESTWKLTSLWLLNLKSARSSSQRTVQPESLLWMANLKPSPFLQTTQITVSANVLRTAVDRYLIWMMRRPYSPFPRISRTHFQEQLPQRPQQIAAKFAEIFEEKTFTPAAIQGFLLERKEHSIKALEEGSTWKDQELKNK